MKEKRKMSNFLVTSNYRIEGETYGDVSREGYERMVELCVTSFMRNLYELDDVIIFGGTVESYHEMNKSIFCKLEDLWLRMDANMLYVDVDTICVKPTAIFDTCDYFRMFDIQEQFQKAYPPLVPQELLRGLHPWWMSNVRYFPNDIPSWRIWQDVTGRLVSNWIDVWAYECIVYNAMFYAQSLNADPRIFYRPEYNCQYAPGQTDKALLDNAHIVHVQATRGIDEAIRKMEELTK